eukprot:6625103-Prorocentrum_lima.AAC.1
MASKAGFVNGQSKLFKDKWETIRPDVPIDLPSKYYDMSDLTDGVYAEIHKVKYQYMIPALRTDGFV